MKVPPVAPVVPPVILDPIGGAAVALDLAAEAAVTLDPAAAAAAVALGPAAGAAAVALVTRLTAAVTADPC